jgi:hypothetical protein
LSAAGQHEEAARVRERSRGLRPDAAP